MEVFEKDIKEKEKKKEKEKRKLDKNFFFIVGGTVLGLFLLFLALRSGNQIIVSPDVETQKRILEEVLKTQQKLNEELLKEVRALRQELKKEREKRELAKKKEAEKKPKEELKELLKKTKRSGSYEIIVQPPPSQATVPLKPTLEEEKAEEEEEGKKKIKTVSFRKKKEGRIHTFGKCFKGKNPALLSSTSRGKEVSSGIDRA